MCGRSHVRIWSLSESVKLESCKQEGLYTNVHDGGGSMYRDQRSMLTQTLKVISLSIRWVGVGSLYALYSLAMMQIAFVPVGMPISKNKWKMGGASWLFT